MKYLKYFESTKEQLDSNQFKNIMSDITDEYPHQFEMDDEPKGYKRDDRYETQHAFDKNYGSHNPLGGLGFYCDVYLPEFKDEGAYEFFRGASYLRNEPLPHDREIHQSIGDFEYELKKNNMSRDDRETLKLIVEILKEFNEAIGPRLSEYPNFENLRLRLSHSTQRHPYYYTKMEVKVFLKNPIGSKRVYDIYRNEIR